MGPEKTVDGWGSTRTMGIRQMQRICGPVRGPSHTGFRRVRPSTLHELWVLELESAVEPYAGFGAKAVKIEYSTDGTKWTPLADVSEFARASGQSDVDNTTVSFGGVSAKYVKS